MSQSIGIKSSPTGPFVYVENTAGESLAFGSDNTAQMFVLNTSASPNVIPATASANINFDPTANGNITFRPNGSGKINALNVASNVVSNKNYVTINTSTGELGSDNSPLTSVSITGDTGGALSGSSFTFTGGTTGLTFAGAATTETLGGTLVVSNGGTGNTTFTAYSVLCAGTTATGAFQNVSGVGSAGQVLTSNGAGALPTWQAAAADFTWNDVTGASASMAVSNGYAANNAGLVTLTLPAIAAFGAIVEVAGNGAGGWLIAQNAGQAIKFGNSSTTVGVAGSVASTNRYDSIRLLCVTANTTWVALSAIGNLTIT